MSQTAEFENRLRRVGRRHRKMMTNGVVRKVGKDGLITSKPRSRMPRFPLKGFVILFVAAFVFKATLLAWLGAADYSARVTALGEGTVIEQGGAWVMQADPMTVVLSEVIKNILPAS